MTPESKTRTLQTLQQMSAEDHYKNYLRFASHVLVLQRALVSAMACGTAGALVGVARSREWSVEVSQALGFASLCFAFHTLACVALSFRPKNP